MQAMATTAQQQTLTSHPLDGGGGLPSCGEVGYLSYFTLLWINPLVDVGFQRQIALEDTPRLAEVDDTVLNAHKLLANFQAAELAGRRHPLIWAVIKSFPQQLLLYEVLVALQHVITILKPLALKQVLAFQEDQADARNLDTHMPPGAARRGLEAIGSMVLINLFEIFLNTHVELYRERLNLRIGSGVRGTVLVQCIKGQHNVGTNKKGEPTVYNVLSMDVPLAVDIVWIVLGIALFPLQFYATLHVLLLQVRTAAVPGLVTILIAKFIVGVFLFCDGFFRHLHLHAKDKRLRACSESFNNIRTLQMLSWVRPHEEHIMEFRKTELHYRAQRLWMSKMGAALDYSLNPIVTLVTFAFFTRATDHQLRASVALPVIDLITSLIGPLAKFPEWINQYIVWRSAYQRTTKYLRARDTAMLGDVMLTGEGSAGEGGGLPPGADAPASFRGCSLSWGSGPNAGEQEIAKTKADEEQPLLEKETQAPAIVLHDLDVSVRGGELLVLLGKEGQGKSSVLHALLGNMQLQVGSLKSPALDRPWASSIDGRGVAELPPSSEEVRRLLAARQDGSTTTSKCAVPYAAQEVLLVAGSVQWNILFGAKHEEALYTRTIQACQLEMDLSSLPAGDRTEVAQGGANLSGGQKARIGLARAVYRAALMAQRQTTSVPLVLLDDVLSALDRRVASDVCKQLFGPGGLLATCAVVLAAADPWFLTGLAGRTRAAVLRGGHIIALGSLQELQRQTLPELPRRGADGPSTTFSSSALTSRPEQTAPSNPQDPLEESSGSPDSTGLRRPKDSNKLLQDQQLQGAVSGELVKDEVRIEGHVKCKTYLAYLESVGCCMLFIIAIALAGISLFENACKLWMTYWTSDHREETRFYKWISRFTDTPPSAPMQLLWIYAVFVACFTVCNFAGHTLEILGGVGAARKIFKGALYGTLQHPFRWWDANPTGRVLNRFSEDVEVMDAAITNILGVIFGAVLYFVSHILVLGIANPLSLILIPVVVLVMEVYARYYRRTVREVQRLYLVSVGMVYQEMVEAILGKVTIRAFDDTQFFLCSSFERLDRFRRNTFTKTCVQSWVKLRMSLIGYCLGLYNTLQPLLEFWGILPGQSAALVGFSINYSRDIMAIVQQFILNYSDLEMQLVSIERLMEYSEVDSEAKAAAMLPPSAEGLRLENVEVQYREGIRPALTNVSLHFPARQAVAIVGRTGAGKSSLLLSVLQLVPYTGRMAIGGHLLASLDPEDVRRRLVGVVPQLPVIFSGDLRWNLDPEHQHSDADLLEALRRVGLQAIVCNGVEALGLEPSDLSAGQRQLLCAARCLLRRPRVALLDEVTANLPPEVAESTVSMLIRRFKDLNAAVLLVTHQEELLPNCERVISIAQGKVVADLMADQNAP